MDDKLEINVQDGKTKFLLLKHYNTLLFTEEKRQQVARNNPKTEVCLHCFRLSDMVGVFEPFLDYIRNGLNGISEEAFDRMLDECGVYSLHKSVFTSFLKTGVCARSSRS